MSLAEQILCIELHFTAVLHLERKASVKAEQCTKGFKNLFDSTDVISTFVQM